MNSFCDQKGNRWTINLTVGSYIKAKALTGLNLYAPFGNGEEEPPLARLLSDPEVFVRILHAIAVEPKPMPAPEELAEAMNGEMLAAAYDVFFKELGFFLPENLRTVLQGMLERYRQAGKDILGRLDQLSATDLPQSSSLPTS